MQELIGFHVDHVVAFKEVYDPMGDGFQDAQEGVIEGQGDAAAVNDSMGRQPVGPAGDVLSARRDLRKIRLAVPVFPLRHSFRLEREVTEAMEKQ